MTETLLNHLTVEHLNVKKGHREVDGGLSWMLSFRHSYCIMVVDTLI